MSPFGLARLLRRRAWQIFLVSNQIQPFEMGHCFNESQREFPPRSPERQFAEITLQIGEPRDIVQFVKGNVETPHRLKIPQKIQVAGCSAIDVKLYIGPSGDYVACLLELRRRQGSVKLQDPTIRFQWPEWVAEPIDHCTIGAQEAAMLHIFAPKH